MMQNRFNEEVSDALSTSAPNSNFGDDSDDDCMNSRSKKIRKKRSAYQKIDDDIRVKLLEAVQQHGETLKSAAKRYGINYSSAKSILHTYRKEGRILKKSAQDRNMKKRVDSYPMTPMTDGYSQMNPQPMPQNSQLHNRVNFRHNLRVNTSRNDYISEDVKSQSDLPSPSSPMNKLTDNFGNLLHLNQNQHHMFDENARNYRPNGQPGQPQNYNKFNLKSDMRGMEYKASQYENSPTLNNGNSHNQNNYQYNDNGLEMFKMIDNFYMNYSNSPLSSEKIVKDGSSKSNGRYNKEFDSFSEMINALQAKTTSEEIRDEIHIPKPLRFNTAQKLQEQIEAQINKEDESTWKGTIENAAIDTFRTVVDAQLLLCDALKKASFLNNLVQIQKSKEGQDPKNIE